MDGADPRLEFDFLNGVGYQAMVIYILITFSSKNNKYILG